MFPGNRRLLFVSLLSIAISVGGCSSLNPLNWWARESGPKIAELPEIKPVVTVRNLWQVNIGNAGNSVFTPAVAMDHAYASGSDGTVAKVEISSGKQVWRVN